MVLNLDIKQTAPVVAPYEEALADLLAPLRLRRRRDRGLVPRHGHRRLLGLRPRDPDLGRHGGHGRLLPGRAGRGDPGTDAPRRPPGPGVLRRGHAGRRAVRGRGPRRRVWPSTCGPSRRRPRWSGCAASAWTASSPTGPGPRRRSSSRARLRMAPAGDGRRGVARPGRPSRSGVGSARRTSGRPDAGVSRARSSASCRGWPSSWPGACACWFVSTQSGKATRSPTSAANGPRRRRPAGRAVHGDLAAPRRGRAGRRRSGRRTVGAGPRACWAGTATKGRWSCPAPGRSIPSGCGSPSTWPSATGTWWSSDVATAAAVADEPAPAAGRW